MVGYDQVTHHLDDSLTVHHIAGIHSFVVIQIIIVLKF